MSALARLFYPLLATLALAACGGSSGGSGAAPIVPLPPPPASDRTVIFDTFTIRGAGGTHDLASAAAAGANTIRTWSVPDGDTQAWLDEAQSLGLKVILGMWLPQSDDGPNPKPGVWQVDYTARRAEYVAKIQDLLDQYDNHPALLMWCLGNEVNISQSFLETINVMSETIHAHNPDRVSCYVGKNGTDIALFAEYATDIDLYGQNSYGYNSLSNSAKQVDQYWKKKFFISEYAWKGPWTANTTVSGYPLELTPSVKVDQLTTAFNVLAEHDKLVGGVFFLWGPFDNGTRTWFSGLLPKDPTIDPAGKPAHLTPFTDTLQEYWTGAGPSDLAPVISFASIDGAYNGNLSLATGQDFAVHVDATDADGDPISYAYWIFETNGGSRGDAVSGSIAGGADVMLTAPANAGSYTLLVHATTASDKASSHQVPFEIN